MKFVRFSLLDFHDLVMTIGGLEVSRLSCLTTDGDGLQ
jgi:hypothetical protein